MVRAILLHCYLWCARGTLWVPGKEQTPAPSIRLPPCMKTAIFFRGCLESAWCHVRKALFWWPLTLSEPVPLWSWICSQGFVFSASLLLRQPDALCEKAANPTHPKWGTEEASCRWQAVPLRPLVKDTGRSSYLLPRESLSSSQKASK